MISQQRCTHCSEYKPIVAFATYKDRSGTPRRRGICAECRAKSAQVNFEKLQAWRRDYNVRNRPIKKEKDRQRRAEAKAFVDAFKDRPCADCGRRWPPVAMDLDHVRGDKVRNVAGLVGGAYRIELIRIELEKCEVVCACCHRVRTHMRGENRAPLLTEVPRVATGVSGRMSGVGTAAALDEEIRKAAAR